MDPEITFEACSAIMMWWNMIDDPMQCPPITSCCTSLSFLRGSPRQAWFFLFTIYCVHLIWTFKQQKCSMFTNINSLTNHIWNYMLATLVQNREKAKMGTINFFPLSGKLLHYTVCCHGNLYFYQFFTLICCGGEPFRMTGILRQNELSRAVVSSLCVTMQSQDWLIFHSHGSLMIA